MDSYPAGPHVYFRALASVFVCDTSTGVGLVEVYDPDTGGDAKVLVRAIGPSLSNSGVQGALADPILEIHDTNGNVQTNDDWRATQENEILATGIPPSNPSESAILAILAPGNYTAIIRGKNDSTGVAVVEAYNLP